MKHQRTMGLVAAGGVARSFLSRMPLVLSRLGPVISIASSPDARYRLARRMVNSLGGGLAVADYQDLSACELIWISVPEPLLERAAAELASGANLRGTFVIICESARDSLWPSPLRTASARVASINPVEETRERIFIAEGDPEAVRMLRRITTDQGRKLIEIHSAAKGLYNAGIHMANHLLLPCFAAAVDSLRAAGLSRADATNLAHSLSARALRSYQKAGRKAWSPVAAPRLRASMAADFETIQAVSPKIAALYAQAIEQALNYLEVADEESGNR